VGNTFSLGVLYILPMMLGALIMRPSQIVALAALCALLRSLFDVPSRHLEAALRFVFSSLAYLSSGLFVTALTHNRALAVEHLRKVQREQGLRHEAEEQLRALVDSSPAAVFTLDQKGVVLAANRAAANLFGIPDGQSILGRVIASYLPLLSDALALGGEDFHTAAQCYGRRDDGDIFLAHTWFSTYTGHDGTRLAAIVVDSSEEMRDREEQNLRHLMRNNRIAAAAVSHEVRNLCGAIAMLTTQLGGKYRLDADQDYGGLIQLVRGLEHVAQLELHSKVQEKVDDVSLRAVLDNLCIVIEPSWKDAECTLRWVLPSELPRVIADPPGLLQAFLNLAQNSLRAVQQMPVRDLKITAIEDDGKVKVRFDDSGPGVADPARLFQPFQSAAEGTGLGLYITRAIVRSYGGELRLEPRDSGSSFVVELQAAPKEAV